jgi:hypothetical protein
VNQKVPAWKEAAGLPFWHFRGFGTINHDTCQSGWSILGLNFEPLVFLKSVWQKRNLNVSEVLHFVLLQSIETGVVCSFPRK